LVLALLTILVLAVAIAAIVVVTAPSQTKVVLRNVVYSDVQHASQALQELVSKNTK
jgi:beta-lactam-binding protein with PASTA domain